MMKVWAVTVLCFGLSGCAVASVAGDVVSTGVSVATTVVSTTADVAGGAVSTVTGSCDKSPKN